MIVPSHVPDRPPSPRVQELSQRIASAIAEYQAAAEAVIAVVNRRC
jgi:hypothetical protein